MRRCYSKLRRLPLSLQRRAPEQAAVDATGAAHRTSSPSAGSFPPAARPKTLKLDREQQGPGGTAVNPQELGRLRDWIELLEKNRGGLGRTRFHFFGRNGTMNREAAA